MRDHWIDQAKFVQTVFDIPKSKMGFDTHHIQDLKLDEKYDVTLFKGVLYHIPNPIGDMERLCKITNEVIIIDTASDPSASPNSFRVIQESKTHVMSGVDGLAWLPSGPEVVRSVLKWQGFPEMRVIRNNRKAVSRYGRGGVPRGRFRVIAARNKTILKNFDRITAQQKTKV